MKRTLEKAAKSGRFGDDRLLHVSQAEIDGLASLLPGGRLPTNPDTGLPEAFFFLPFLAGLGAMAAPAAAATAALPAMTAVGTGALGAGLAAGTAAAAPALAGAAGTAAGLGALAAPTALTAAAAPAATTALTAAAPTALTAAAPAATAAGTAAGTAAINSGLPLTAGVSTMAPSGGLTAIEGAFGAANAPGIGAAVPLAPVNPITATAAPMAGDLAAGIGPQPFAPSVAGQSFFPPSAATMAPVNPVTTPAAGGVGSFPAAPASPAGVVPETFQTAVLPEMAGAVPAGAGQSQSVLGGIGGLTGGMDINKMMQGMGMLSMMRGKGGSSKKKDGKKDISGVKYEGGDPKAAPDEYQAGIDPEWRYFPMKSGGVVKGYAGGGVITEFKPTSNAGIAALQQGIGQFQAPAMAPITVAPPTGTAVTGIVGPTNPIVTPGSGTDFKSIIELQKTDPTKWLEQMKENRRNSSRKEGGLIQGFAEGGLASLPQGGGEDLEEIPPQPTSNEDDASLIEATVKAVQGQVPQEQAQVIIAQFVQTFGEQALQDLMMKVQGGAGPQGAANQTSATPTMSDGMSDSIPAQINGPGGASPAALSEGEYVVPADVVSGIGNGSTDAGAQQLDGMLGRVRQMRTGGLTQPPAMNPQSAMPV